MENETVKPIKMQKLFNPTSEDLNFQWGSAIYRVPAGEEETFTEDIAVHGAKKLADKNILTTDPAEHRVLTGAYLENSEPEVIAERLGIDLTNMRKEAMTKEKAKSRVINLEAQMLDERAKRLELEAKVNALLEKKEEIKEEKKEIEPEIKVKVEETSEVKTNYEGMSWNDIKKIAREKNIYESSMTKEDILKELNK